MKFSLALGPRRRLDRSTAWGCLVANLAIPGSGSLAAGRVSGYLQMAAAVVGLALTVSYGGRFFTWYLANWSRLRDAEDQFGSLHELWDKSRGCLLGMGVFTAGLLWSLLTSWLILREATDSGTPPRLK